MKHNLSLCFYVLLISCGELLGQSNSIWKELRSDKNAVQNEIKTAVHFVDRGYNIENQLDLLLDSMAIQHRKSNLIRGFRIQIYAGNEREEASKAKEIAYRTLPFADVYTSYQSPTFKVKVGDFYQRLEAQLTLKKIEMTFPAAVIVEEVVHLKP